MAAPKILIELGITSSDLEKKLDSAVENTNRLKETKADLAAQNKLTAAEEARFNAEIKQSADVQRKAETQLKAYIAATKAAEGSIDRAAGISKVLTAEFNAMSAEEREATERGKELAAALKIANDELRNQGVATGNMRANVGNYNEAINNSVLGLRSNIAALKSENEALDISSDKFKENQERIEVLTQKLNVASGKVDEFGDRVKKSAAAENLDRINDAGQAVTQTMGLFALAAAGSTQAGENEQKVMQALAVVTGLYTIAKGRKAAMELLDTARTTIATGAQAAYTAVMGTSAGAVRLFNLALAATPWGLAAIGIGVAIAYWDDLTKSIKDAVTGQNSYAEAVAKMIPSQGETKYNTEELIKLSKTQLDAFDEEIGKRKTLRELSAGGVKDIQRQIEIATKSGANEKTMFDLNQKLAKAQLDNIAFETTALKKLASTYSSNYILQDEVNTRLLKLDSDRLDIEAKNNGARLELISKEREARKRLLDELSGLESKILSDNLDYQLQQLAANFEKESKIIEDAYGSGVEKDARYFNDKLALRQYYLTQVQDLMAKEFGYEGVLRQQQLDATATLNQQVTDSITKRDNDVIAATQNYLNYTYDAYDEFNQKQADSAAKSTALVNQITDDFSNALESSFEDGELNAKKFQKQILLMMLKTAEAQVLIQTPAITAALTAQLGLGGVPASIVTIASIKALFGLARVAVSQFRKGGTIPKAANGVLVGASHAQGGIPIRTPGGMIEAEGGEAIITKRATETFLPLLSAINQAGGGKSLTGTTNQLESGIIDYNALAAAMSRLNVNVNVNDITDAQNTQNSIKAKARI